MLLTLPATTAGPVAGPLTLAVLGLGGLLAVVVVGTVVAALGNRRADDPVVEPVEELLPQ